MPKQIILPDWDPARLVRGSDRWYIDFLAVSNGQRRRFRPTFNLNRIHDLRERELRGQELVAKMNWWLRSGRNPEDFVERKVPAKFVGSAVKPEKHDRLILDAIEYARELKTKSDREETNRTYNSICKLLSMWIQETRLEGTMVGEFSKANAADYLDYCRISRKVGARTYNNNLRDCRTIFSTLEDRGFISGNPFGDFKYLPVGEKGRRNFTDAEAREVVQMIVKNNRLLFYALVLEYACLIRPAELRRLKFENIHADHIVIKSSQAKSRRERSPTIPASFQPIFREEFWSKYPAHWFIFGEGFKPNASKPCGEKTMYNRHRKILLDLKKKGKLDDINGLTWYSWKDSGITEIIDQIGLEPARVQAGHTLESTTRVYQHPKAGNKKMLVLENKLL